jgi:hypothetical protein
VNEYFQAKRTTPHKLAVKLKVKKKDRNFVLITTKTRSPLAESNRGHTQEAATTKSSSQKNSRKYLDFNPLVGNYLLL